MLAYHNDQKIKDRYIARVRAHRAADQLIQGTGWEPQWAVWMLEDPEHGVIRHAGGRADVEAAIRRVAELWRSGGSAEEFRAARAAAADAAWKAARAAWTKAACAKLIALLEDA